MSDCVKEFMGQRCGVSPSDLSKAQWAILFADFSP
jgi:hypothetical protein